MDTVLRKWALLSVFRKQPLLLASGWIFRDFQENSSVINSTECNPVLVLEVLLVYKRWQVQICYPPLAGVISKLFLIHSRKLPVHWLCILVPKCRTIPAVSPHTLSLSPPDLSLLLLFHLTPSTQNTYLLLPERYMLLPYGPPLYLTFWVYALLTFT